MFCSHSSFKLHHSDSLDPFIRESILPLIISYIQSATELETIMDGASPFEPTLSEKLLGPTFDMEEQQHQQTEHLTTAGAAEYQQQPVTPGTKQPTGLRDIAPALLFVAHLIYIAYIGFVWGIPSLNYRIDETDDDDSRKSIYENPSDTTTIHFGGMFALTTQAGLVALTVAFAIFSLLGNFIEQTIQLALLLAVGVNALLIIFFAVEKLWSGAILSTVVLLVGACYARAIWRRIPFATANLKAALVALQANGGIAFVAYAMVGVFILYSYVFLLAWLGVYTRSAICHPEEEFCDLNMGAGWIAFFILSFYWTAHVIKNMLHVTVSGLVGTWYFCPEDASQFCSPAIMDSLSRASTYSFGSICFGSLLTAVLQILHTVARQAVRQQHRASLLMCVLQCVLGFLDRLVTYFNKYAMVYVGLYGYDYLTAGKKTADLFAARGWTMILNDDLVGRVLMLLNLVIGALAGAFGLFLATVFPSWTEEFGTAEALVAFGFPFFVGTAMSSVLVGVVSSAVDTIVVTFCEAPMDFERNHPGLHRQMVSAWRQVYPEVMGSLQG